VFILWELSDDMGFVGGQSASLNKPDNESGQLSAALNDFRDARRRAAVRAVLGRLQGTSLELLSYEEVTAQLGVSGQFERGVQEIPVDKIVGSVGRYDEFDNSFLPLKDRDAQRWAGVRAAAPDPTRLPPIDVYQIGDAYFVIDGNHRVSIARHTGLEFIAAHIIEIETRVPFPKDIRHDEMILASEEATFLEWTQLDRLHPEADLETSLPGQYDKLENHIEVHRFFLEMKEERELSDEEAVRRWYAEAYLPVVEAIREYGLMREFNNRTETDLYLWIAENQAALRNEVGWDVGPKTAVENLSPPQEIGRQNKWGRFYRRVLQAVIPQKRPVKESWSKHKTLDRYSDRLFAIILAIAAGDDLEAVVTQAAILARNEQAHLFAVQLISDEQEERVDAQNRSARELFEKALGEGASLSGEIFFEQLNPYQVLLRRANLVDLIVLDTTLLAGRRKEQGEVAAILDSCNRPVLLVPGSPRPVKRILLLYDNTPQSREALFATAYMAELWGCQVVVLSEPDAAPGALNKAAPYLEMHETPPEIILAGPLVPDHVFQTAVENHCDLVVVGGYGEGPFNKPAVVIWLHQAPENLKRLLFVCP
jgi:nucleotide-binding universal stress UspA family protein